MNIISRTRREKLDLASTIRLRQHIISFTNICQILSVPLLVKINSGVDSYWLVVSGMSDRISALIIVHYLTVWVEIAGAHDRHHRAQVTNIPSPGMRGGYVTRYVILYRGN